MLPYAPGEDRGAASCIPVVFRTPPPPKLAKAEPRSSSLSANHQVRLKHRLNNHDIALNNCFYLFFAQKPRKNIGIKMLSLASHQAISIRNAAAANNNSTAMELHLLFTCFEHPHT